MPLDTTIISVAHVIQLAVAPVFCSLVLAAILAVLVNRLARIIDRTRMVESKMLKPESASLRGFRLNWMYCFIVPVASIGQSAYVRSLPC